MEARLAPPVLAALVVSALCLSARAQPPQRPNPMLHRQGTKIVDAQGTEVPLRGVNLGGWLLWEGWIFGKGPLTSETTILTRLEQIVGPRQTEEFRSQVYDTFVTEADVQRIARAGFNCVRVPLHHRLLDGDRGRELLDRLLGWCERHRVYVVLDLHAAPGGQSRLGMADPGDARHLLWNSEENQERTVAVWKSMAARYHDRKVVAGYDLLNEPAPPSGEALLGLYRRIIRAVRAEDPDHLIFLEGGQFASDFSMFEGPLCENQAFSFHMYTWFGDDREKRLAAYRAFARRQDTALWAGEFGENSYEMIRSTVALYGRCPEVNGWAFWTWKKAPTGYPGLVTVRVPEDWRGVMGWVGGLFRGEKPSPAKGQAGMKAFIEAMKLENCDYDERMEKALSPKRD